MTSWGVKGPGAYHPCSTGERFDIREAKYFENHRQLKWIPTSISQASSVPGAIKVQNPAFLE